MDTDAVLELLQGLASLVSELQVTYYVQDGDEIERLDQLTDQLWNQLVEHVDGELRWKTT